MSEGGLQSVLRCGICHKPFDGESTLKRHGYYCRSRSAGTTTRIRSCVCCAKAKTRCNNRRPKCSRCTAKSIECQYPANDTHITSTRRKQHGSTKDQDGTPFSPGTVLDVDDGQDANTAAMFAIPSETPRSDLPTFDESSFDWDSLNINLDEYMNPRFNNKTLQYPPLEQSPVTPFKTHTFQTNQTQQALFLKPTIPASPSFSPRSLMHRPTTKAGSTKIAKLIFATLKSFPLMMLRDNARPPFIHSQFVLLGNDTKSNSMEPLNNCISLMHMLRSGVQGSRKLFWRNVGLECEQLGNRHSTLDKWGLLAAMQALAIYVLIRLDEGETDDNNYDSLLVRTVIVFSQSLAQEDVVSNAAPALLDFELKSSWKEWVFEESKRRLCVIYQVLNLLVYFDPAAMCDVHENGLILAPLPAKRQLWEAGDQFAWEMERAKDPGLRTHFGLAVNGDLVRVHDDPPYCDPAAQLYKPFNANAASRSNANWEEWCAGMDGFAGLIMLAASLTA